MKNDRIKRRQYYFVYTLLFVLTACISYSYLYLNGYITMRKSDGQNQYYYSLIYYGKYIREILNNIFIAHNFEIPMWDMTIGYGSDILTTLHYYGIGDPLNLLAVFFAKSNTWILYCLLVLIRIYLAGISFSLFSFYHGNDRKATMLGALVYCFCGWTTVIGIQYVAFVLPLIYFPLLLLGVDKIYKEKKPFIFMIGIFLSAISNFYFFYMLCIFVFLYVIFQYFNLCMGREIPALFCTWCMYECIYFISSTSCFVKWRADWNEILYSCYLSAHLLYIISKRFYVSPK